MNQMTRWNIIAENGRRAPRGAGRGSMELDQGIITKEVTRFRSAGYIALIGLNSLGFRRGAFYFLLFFFFPFQLIF